ncbi:6096_t:CDS:2, partial [Dentiscutata heterogama]
PEEEEEMSIDGEEQSDTSSKKCSNKGTNINLSILKKKTKKAVRREDSHILKKLIKELSAPILQQSSSSSIIFLQTFPDMDINLVNFYKLDDKIINAEDSNKNYSRSDSYILLFWERHFLNQNKVSEANLRKRKERAIKIFKLFDVVGEQRKIYCIKSFSVSTISRLGMNNIGYVKAKVLKLSQVYFPTVELLRKSILETAVKQYTNKLSNAITMCKLQKLDTIVKKLEQISQRFSKIPQINMVNTGCSMKVEGVLNKVCGYLEWLDLTSIDSSDPIASRIIDISKGVDSMADKLLVETKQVFEKIELSEPEFSEKMITMLDEFINTYELLGPNFNLALVNPIIFP